MAETKAPDPRIALLIEQDRRLGLVGNGTMAMMLAAAEAIGLIPKATAVTEYGIASPSDPSSIILLASLDGAVSYVKELRETTPDHDYRAVACVHTYYEDAFTEWTPVPMPEETHV